VIAALQSLGGTPTVTLKTTHRYYDGTPAPAGAPDPAAAPAPDAAPGDAQPPADPNTGAQRKPGVSLVVAHWAAARRDGATRLADQPPLKLRRSAEASAKAEARQGAGGARLAGARQGAGGVAR
jgi:hypothetical protein